MGNFYWKTKMTELFSLLSFKCSSIIMRAVLHYWPRRASFRLLFSIMEKLELRSIAGLVKFAVKNGLSDL